MLVGYLGHPEAKSLAPDGAPVVAATAGVLLRRPVEGIPPLARIGKEGNRLDDRLSGLLSGPEEYRTEYVDPADNTWTSLVVPVLKSIDRSDLIEQSGLHRRSIERLLSGQSRPRLSHELLLTEIALRHARQRINSWGETIPPELRKALHVLDRLTPTHGIS